ncbi:MAG: restriction endonuclease subunit S [Tissierellia bacterium]|nr:restriction endonuclease subunit S [Tissierellia bacterium]
MRLTKLGDYIEAFDERNKANLFDTESVVGLSTQKKMIETKADLVGVSLSNYKLFPPQSFAYVADTSRRGEKMSLAYNDSENTYLVSSISTVFRIVVDYQLSADYLFMYFNRPEFDRYSRFNSWGSARETFSWEDMCDIEIELPPLEIQQKYVDVYKSMLANQACYERSLEDLKLVCDGYIEDLRRKIPPERLEKYIERKNIRNYNGELTLVMGLSTKKEFREPQSRVNRDKLHTYKIVSKNDIAFVPTTDTWKVLAFAINTMSEDIVVSPIYEVFSINQRKIISEYLGMWLSRTEFDRYARYNSWGSARENFDWSEMCEVKIPIPPIEIQQDIVDIYNVYIERKEINEKLKAQIKDICPILIKGSLDESSL